MTKFKSHTVSSSALLLLPKLMGATDCHAIHECIVSSRQWQIIRRVFYVYCNNTNSNIVFLYRTSKASITEQYQYDDSVNDDFEREPFSVKVHSKVTGKYIGNSDDLSAIRSRWCYMSNTYNKPRHTGLL